MLALHGTASFVQGFDGSHTPLVLRVRALGSAPSAEADAALLRSPDDVYKALELGFSSAIAVGDKTEIVLPLFNSFPRLMVLPSRFDYLRDGDILGIRGKGQVRTLFRQESHHNSFLVTDRV
jgi:hypothetical protein